MKRRSKGAVTAPSAEFSLTQAIPLEVPVVLDARLMNSRQSHTLPLRRTRIASRFDDCDGGHSSVSTPTLVNGMTPINNSAGPITRSYAKRLEALAAATGETLTSSKGSSSVLIEQTMLDRKKRARATANRGRQIQRQPIATATHNRYPLRSRTYTPVIVNNTITSSSVSCPNRRVDEASVKRDKLQNCSGQSLLEKSSRSGICDDLANGGYSRCGPHSDMQVACEEMVYACFSALAQHLNVHLKDAVAASTLAAVKKSCTPKRGTTTGININGYVTAAPAADRYNRKQTLGNEILPIDGVNRGFMQPCCNAGSVASLSHASVRLPINPQPMNYAFWMRPSFSDLLYPLFVTWRFGKERRLRGCIGTFSPVRLSCGLREYAISSAIRDNRFSQIKKEEFKHLDCAVSILINFEPAKNYLDWEIGLHGIRIELQTDRGKKSATYLPEVAQEQGWNHVQAIDSLMKKAGYRGYISTRLRESLIVTRYRSEKVCRTYGDYVERITSLISLV